MFKLDLWAYYHNYAPTSLKCSVGLRIIMVMYCIDLVQACVCDVPADLFSLVSLTFHGPRNIVVVFCFISSSFRMHPDPGSHVYMNVMN